MVCGPREVVEPCILPEVAEDGSGPRSAAIPGEFNDDIVGGLTCLLEVIFVEQFPVVPGMELGSSASGR